MDCNSHIPVLTSIYSVAYDCDPPKKDVVTDVPPSPPALIAGPVAAAVVVVVVAAILGIMEWRKRRRLQTHADQLNAFSKSLVGVRHVTNSVDYVAMCVAAPEAGAGLCTGADENSDDSSANLPADLVALFDFALLITKPGQLVQEREVRGDGWVFGAILHDPAKGFCVLANPFEIRIEPCHRIACNYSTGWFPRSSTELATATHLANLHAQIMGDHDGGDALAAPPHWASQRDLRVAETIVLPTGPERLAAVTAFKASLPSSIAVVGVERVQNMAIWQSYALNRQRMVARDATVSTASGGSSGELEKKWLFKGAAADTIPRIIQRGFAGKNQTMGEGATVYGKGLYFAKHSSYAASPSYSPPDRTGVQHMFLCRVLTGFTSKGVRYQRQPDVRDGPRKILYDSTTNDAQTIFVTYCDSQQYPEYVVRFKDEPGARNKPEPYP